MQWSLPHFLQLRPLRWHIIVNYVQPLLRISAQSRLSLTLCEATVISVNRSIANLHLPQLRERLGLGKGINCSSSWTNQFSWFNMSVPGGGGKEEGLWRDNKWRDSISDCSPQTRSLRSVCLSFHLSDSGDPLLILEQPASIPFPWPLLTREETLDEPRRVLNPRWKRREHKPHSRPKNNRYDNRSDSGKFVAHLEYRIVYARLLRRKE